MKSSIRRPSSSNTATMVVLIRNAKGYPTVGHLAPRQLSKNLVNTSTSESTQQCK